MNTDNIEKLIKLLKENDLAAIEYSHQDEQIKITARPTSSDLKTIQPVAAAPTPSQEKQPVMATKVAATSNNTINSPSVGVFYTAKPPQETSYVKVGDKVKKGDVVGVIEVMKAFTDVIADREGIVEKVLVNNEEGVEYGQPLIQLK